MHSAADAVTEGICQWFSAGCSWSSCFSVIGFIKCILSNAEMFSFSFLFFFMILVQEDAESRAFPAVGNQPFRESSV